ncbi:toxin-antitoxin system, antitoxin component [Gallibacterium salpingitidis]|uniref:Toxin-antitoxin system, antitoxin component n=1 Tax=Gallibacterium salpingitidis TaxID=505341 RepID=A0AB36E1A4_9PAST|nr:BrnA antitoxin family protein [Gallibacterium salpingitidis]OBX09081.1 toxin-antitoxin system, antitoxin component [Gallibacterium salpingitidis]OBX09649.1 toxin-antitoxin system, antitoxin component [Gallibacterium salpingitidis]WKT00817.1 BrnA antitoxin family protein [Gallibacterium salpingitidis]
MKTDKTRPMINDDGEVRELSKADFDAMKPLADVMPKEFIDMVLAHQSEMEKQGKIKPRTRGKQKSPTKQAVTIRLSPEIIEAFKAEGKGWQSRINEVLLQHIRS